MFSIISFRKPLPVRSGIRVLSLPLILTGMLAAPLMAQSGAGVSPDSRPQNGWGGHRGSPRHRMEALGAAEGPASPAILRDTVQLSGGKLDQYTKKYNAYIASTKVTRDSLRSNLQAMRSAFQGGDRSKARDQRDLIMSQAQDLQKRDQEFEQSVKPLLNKDQQKRYDTWKNDRQKNAQERWRGEHPDSSPDAVPQAQPDR
jgi:Spy/CpxP family protein refolding chaperone